MGLPTAQTKKDYSKLGIMQSCRGRVWKHHLLFALSVTVFSLLATKPKKVKALGLINNKIIFEVKDRAENWSLRYINRFQMKTSAFVEGNDSCWETQRKVSKKKKLQIMETENDACSRSYLKIRGGLCCGWFKHSFSNWRQLRNEAALVATNVHNPEVL